MSKKNTKRDWIYFLKKGEKAFAIGDYENSYDYLCKSIFESINLYPYNSKAYLLRSLINYEWGFLREAKIDLTNAITRKSSPGFYEFYLRGLIYLRFNNLKNAIKDFKKSILLNPNHFESHFNKGACNYDLGNYDSAVLDFNNAYKIKKNDEDLFFNRGIAYFASGNYKKAIIDFDNINNINNFKRDIFFYRGQSESRLSNYINAKENFTYLINSIITSAYPSRHDELLCSSYLERAWAYARIDMPHKSLEDLKKSLNFSCKGELFYKHLIITGYTYSKLDKYSDSIRFYNQAEKYIEKGIFTKTQKAFLLMLRSIIWGICEEYEEALSDVKEMFILDKKILEKDEEKVFDEMPEYMKNIVRISLNISLS